MSRIAFRRTADCLLLLFLVVLCAAAPALADEAILVKLDAKGNELAADAGEWAMVRDRKTGLTWEAKTSDGSVHDADNQYTWNEAREVFLAGLNSAAFGGYTDWRLPNDAEISSIMRWDREEPFVDTAFFPGIRPANYWNFYICGSGAVMNDSKSFGKKSTRSARHRVIAVRGKEL